MRRVYLDNSATTPVDPRVVEAMLPYLTEKFGNASSVHFYGQEARVALDRARREVAALINARPNALVFLSGGTQANNTPIRGTPAPTAHTDPLFSLPGGTEANTLAIRGIAESNVEHGRHIITSQIEHSAVRGVCDALEKRGWEVTRLPVYEDGIVRLEDVRAALRPDTVLITVMLANNEIGTIQPVGEVAALVREERERGRKYLWLHTDAVQAAGRIPVDVDAL